ncbi:MAG: FAD-dependent oxidoreductase [Egibacteraceae bacterium]
MTRRAVDVAVVGSGPAGLVAARRLAAAGADVVVLEREAAAGGVPRHSAHTGYGLRDRRRALSGPAYAARLVEEADAAGAALRTEATVTGWAGPRSLTVTSPAGLEEIDAGAVVLATGARERPRPARLIAGDRPMGVVTTGLLQQIVHLHDRLSASRAVVVGAELVSWSAVLTLREAGCATVLMTSEHDVAETPAPLRWLGPRALGVPVAAHTRIARIIGRGRVEAVEVVDTRSGARRRVACDLVVLTGSWRAESELARTAGLQVGPAGGGPVVDTELRTSAPGVFAAGNLVHPVDTADVAALGGAHVAGAVRRWLEAPAPPPRGVALTAEAPLAWVAPMVLRPGDRPPPRRRLLAWSTEARPVAHVRLLQDGREITRRRLPWAVSPGRVLRLPATLLDAVDLSGGPVRLTLA